MSSRSETIQPIGLPAAMLPGAGARWRENAFRAAAVLATSFFLVRGSIAYTANPSRITLLLVLLTEAMSVALLLLSMTPKTRDTQPVALACVVWAYMYVMLLRVDPGEDWIGPAAGTVICGAGVLLTLWGQMTIGRCFGILPAARGIVQSGPYRFVRHPIYTGYFIVSAGFILTNWTWQNAAVLASWFVCQTVRAQREEAVLRQEPAYRAYCDEVRCRFVPAMF